MNSEVLKKAGIDYEKGLRRFLDDRELYESVLVTFLDDDSLKQAKSIFEAGDYRALFPCVHGMKGMSANLDMTDLYRVCCKLTELLRDNGTPDALTVASLFQSMETAYIRAQKGILQAKGE